MKWKILSKEKKLSTFIFDLYTTRFKSEDTGKEGDFTCLETGDWINIVPVTSSGKVIMVEQFRYGINDVAFEFPGGMVDPGENPDVCASRELKEEVGAISEKVFKTGVASANPAFLNNYCHFYFAKNAEIKFDQDLDGMEEINVHLFSHEEVEEMIDNGKIHNSLCIASWFYYKRFN